MWPCGDDIMIQLGVCVCTNRHMRVSKRIEKLYEEVYSRESNLISKFYENESFLYENESLLLNF